MLWIRYSCCMDTSRKSRFLVALVCLGLGCSTNGDMTMPGQQDMRMSMSGDGMGSGSQDMASQVSEDQACTMQAQAVCNLFSRCSPFTLTFDFVDMASCVARIQPYCTGT